MRNHPRIAAWIAGSIAVFLVLNVFGDWVSWSAVMSRAKKEAKPQQAQAVAQYTPTAGILATGTNIPVTAAAASGNTGGWQGTLASDSFTWTVSSTASGFDQELAFDGTNLNNANTMIIALTAGSNSATSSRLYQICDWTSTTGVDNALDGNCTGGGWRTLNSRKVAITTAASTAYIWHIYDGYWSTAANANVALSTPLSNFINASNGRILLRSYSTTNCTTCTHFIDYSRVETVIDPIYMPAGMVTSTASTVTGDYRNTNTALFASPSASDNNYLQVAGTASITADFYLSFKNVRTYTGMNAIVVRAEYSCSATGINHRPKIYNFTSASWEDLTTTSIACSATDATGAFAKNNITMSDYISSGEVRIGWRGLSNGTQALRIDQIYMMVGSVNTNSSLCEISFGTGTATNCTYTRDLDTTLATPNTWQQTTEAESTALGHAYYAQDNDADATSAEHAASANLSLPTTIPSPGRVTGLIYAMNWRSNVSTITAAGQFKDQSGGNATISGGWTLFGTTNAATTYTYEDSVTNGYFVSNPDDYLDMINGLVRVRVRTSASTNTTGVTRDIDFVFTSAQWAETTPARYTLNNRNVSMGGILATGTNIPVTAAAASGNTGGWQGTLASDSFTWTVSSTASGFDQELYTDNFQQNDANQLIISLTAGSNSATSSRVYQICDWSSTTGVDNALDGNCTGGGWRTLNSRKVAITTAASTAYQWYIYDGYWSTAANTNVALSTPISNFINASSGRVLVRAYSTTNCATCTHFIDYMRIDGFINSVYMPAGVTTSTTSTVTGDYRNTNTALFASPSASDNAYLQVAGTASSISDFYMSFRNINTYSSMNTILVRAEYSCSATGINHRPKIYKFASSTWEDLTTTSIACSATDATNAFAKSNVTVTDYISNGEIRIGWYGLSNGTQAIRIDQIYVMLGSVNTDSSLCEISFGTGTATNCIYTRSLDTTLASPSTWQQTTEAESTALGHAYYAQDNDADATSAEHAASANLWLPVSVPANAQTVGRVFALNLRSNVTTVTMQPQFRDLSGFNATVSGGWTNFGTSNALATFAYQDSVANGIFSSNVDDYVDTYNGRVNMRFRTSVSTNVAGVTRDIDFAMAGLQWVEPAGLNPSITLTMDTSSVPFGNLTAGSPIFATSTATVAVSNLTSGYQIMIDHNNTSSVLLHTDASTLFPDYTDWDPTGSGNATSSPGATLAFRLASSTANFNSTWWGTTGSPLFAGVPASLATIMNSTTTNSGTTTSTVNYRIDVPSDQKTGTYSGGVTYTVLSNP